MGLKKIDNWATNSLIFLAVLIRIVILSFVRYDFWHDASFTYLFSKMPLQFILSGNDTHPPLYYLLMKFLLLFSSNEFYIRATSLLFFILFMFALAKYLSKFSLFFTKWLVLLFFALSPTMVFYSLEPRNYMLGMFFVVVQFYFFRCLLDEDPTPKRWYGFIVFSLLMLYTHYFTVFILLFEVIWWWFSSDCHSPVTSSLGSAMILVVLCSLPLIPYFFETLTKLQNMWFKTVTLNNFFSAFYFQFLNPPHASLIYVVIFVVVFLLSLFVLKQIELKHLLLFVLPVFLCFLISVCVTPIFHPRFFLFFAFGLYVFVAEAFERIILFSSKPKFFIGSFVLLLFIFSLVAGLISFQRDQNNELFEAQLKMKSFINKTDHVVFIHTSPFSQSPFRYYFRDYNNVKNLLYTNLTTKQLFSAGGSVIPEYLKINNTGKINGSWLLVSDVRHIPRCDNKIFELRGLVICKNKN